MWPLALLSLFALLLGTPAEPVTGNGTPIVVRYVREEIPLDPEAKLWRKIPPVRIPLKAQDITPPYGGGSIKAVAVKAVHNGREVAFLLEWADPTEDATTDGLESFRDAAALMFPLDPQNPAEPLMGHRYMGERSALVNIWQFKADWNREGRRSPIEDLNAAGPGTLTAQDQQNVSGKGLHRGGRWKAIFLRSLKTDDEDDAEFWPGLETRLNVAVWNGSRKDHAGQKSVSELWRRLIFEATPVRISPHKGPGFPR
jgi:DMSO reductase family type II enzyme heme b subunit